MLTIYVVRNIICKRLQKHIVNVSAYKNKYGSF